MNVSCPRCQTVFRVDPEKVPAAGVRARCSVCSGVFPVSRVPAEAATPAPPSSPAFAVEMASPPLRPIPVPARPGTPAATFAGPVAPTFAPEPAPHRAAVVAAVSPARPPRPANPFLAQDPHARARRLARALVSDIVVYHPAKRRDGLRDGSLPHLFEAEIRKSWEEYVEQVGRDLAESTRFFTDALNDILADGQPVFP